MDKINRYIRLRDAPDYLGMDKNRFRKLVKPLLIAIPIGKQGIAFDRLDLDAWADHYKHCNGRPVSEKRRQLWEKERYQDLRKLAPHGMSIKRSTADDFAKVLGQVTSKKQKGI